MKIHIYTTTILLIICFLLGGCYSDESIEKGTCRVTVKGYFNKSFSGQAVYENVPTGRGYILFFLVLKEIIETGINYHYVEFQSGSKPNIGVCSVANLENHGDSTLTGIPARYNDSEYYGTYQSTGGILEINSSSNNILKGKFNFIAYEYVPNNNGEFTRVEITVTGEFNAEEGNTGIIIN